MAAEVSATVVEVDDGSSDGVFAAVSPVPLSIQLAQLAAVQEKFAPWSVVVLDYPHGPTSVSPDPRAHAEDEARGPKTWPVISTSAAPRGPPGPLRH